MWKEISFSRRGCRKAGAWLEEAADLPEASATADGLYASLSPEQQGHLRGCSDCQAALQDFADSRVLLHALRDRQTTTPPFFAKRVMAMIASCEGDLERAARAWAFVPKLASRFAGVATVLLLVGGAWVYEGSLHKSTSPLARTVQPAAEAGTQLFEDNVAVPANRDEVLVSLLERDE